MVDVPAGLPAGGALERAIEAATARPLLVAAAVLLVLVLAVAVYRRRSRSPAERLRRTLAGPDRVTVLMHPSPDPDAMACALGVAAIAESVGTAVDLAYSGTIRHQENRAFHTVLDLDLECVTSAEDFADEVVLVDHNELRGFAGAGVTPIAVVDHHPGGGTGRSFTDVRIDRGACASIVADYFETLGADRGSGEIKSPSQDEDAVTTVDGDLRLTPRIATGLLYGIISDTTTLTRGCTDAEFEAARYLYPAVDADALDRIANPEVDADVLEVKAAAITGRVVRGPYAVADVGSVPNGDAVPQAAEELVTLEGVSSVVVLADDGDSIQLSGRSRDDRVHMGEALDAAVGSLPGASAGGHARMGGGRVPIGEDGELDLLGEVYREDLIEHIFEALRGER